jgi:RNA-binding protein
MAQTTHEKPKTDTMTSLNQKQRQWLKQQAHHLKPVVMLGQHGFTEAVLREIQIALAHHELIKIKISAGDREERDRLITAIAEQAQAELVQRVGNMASFYRCNPDKTEPMTIPVMSPRETNA